VNNALQVLSVGQALMSGVLSSWFMIGYISTHLLVKEAYILEKGGLIETVVISLG